jgi:hypothetical protein
MVVIPQPFLGSANLPGECDTNRACFSRLLFLDLRDNPPLQKPLYYVRDFLEGLISSNRSVIRLHLTNGQRPRISAMY